MGSHRADVDLSILIPTRNRPNVAKLAIVNALSAAGPNDEVVVADNSDSPLDLDIDDSRLRVIRADRVLSMPDNWENALQASRGEWTILLGDKFRIVPAALARLRRSIPSGIKTATYSRPDFWQGLPDARTLDWIHLAAAPGTLVRSDAPLRSEAKDAAPAFRRWFETIGYLIDLPMLYTALVHRDVFEAVRAKSSRFFFGNSPDVASSLQILSNVHSYWETNYPAVLAQIPGDPLLWSTGASNLVGGELAKDFAGEFGQSPFERYKLPPGVTSGVFETLLAYQEVHGSSSPKPSWRKLASQATREIEAHRRTGKMRQHIGLLRATQWPRPRPLAALEHARMLGILRTYRVLTRVVPGLPKIVQRIKGVDQLSRRSEEVSLAAAIKAIEADLAN